MKVHRLVAKIFRHRLRTFARVLLIVLASAVVAGAL